MSWGRRPPAMSGSETAVRAEDEAERIDRCALIEGLRAEAGKELERVIRAADALDANRTREAKKLRLEVFELRAEDVAGCELHRAVEEGPDRPLVLERRDGGTSIDESPIQIAPHRAGAAEHHLLGEWNFAAARDRVDEERGDRETDRAVVL